MLRSPKKANLFKQVIARPFSTKPILMPMTLKEINALILLLRLNIVVASLAMNVSIAENNSIRSREPVQRKIYRHQKKLKFKKNIFLSFILIFFIDKNLKYAY
jgi:hypothetical protein